MVLISNIHESIFQDRKIYCRGVREILADQVVEKQTRQSTHQTSKDISTPVNNDPNPEQNIPGLTFNSSKKKILRIRYLWACIILIILYSFFVIKGNFYEGCPEIEEKIGDFGEFKRILK